MKNEIVNENIPNITNTFRNLTYYSTFIALSSPLNIVYFCQSMWGIHGLGNKLSIYWLTRAFAFYNHYIFKSVCDLTLNERNQIFDKKCNCDMFSPDIWSNYLPHLSSIQYNGILSPYINYGNYLINSLNFDQHSSLYPHSYFINKGNKPFILTFENNLFNKIIIAETSKAFKKFKLIDINIQNEFNDNNNNLIIYIRCGDMWSLQISPAYGFMGMNYFKYAIYDIFKINNIKIINKIYIFGQTSSINLRKQFKSYLNQCNNIIYSFIEEFKIRFNTHNVYHIGNGTINNDFYMMSKTKYLICSVSTFCLFAGMANKNGFVLAIRMRAILKKYGYDFNTSNGLIPINHHYVNEENMLLQGPTIAKHHMTVQSVMEYIVTH